MNYYLDYEQYLQIKFAFYLNLFYNKYRIRKGKSKMTIIQYFKGLDLYRVWENGHVSYCTLDEVLYLLSKKEGEVNLEKLACMR